MDARADADAAAHAAAHADAHAAAHAALDARAPGVAGARRFKQVDVFSSVPFKGNPLAVVLDADGLSDAQMHAIARWTNLSETTFVLPASDARADYRVRIFSPGTEFPFAGHPTLGTAHALLEAGLRPKTPGLLQQECGIGLVPVRMGAGGSLAFRAPAARLTALDASLLPALERAMQGSAFLLDPPPLVATMGISWLIVRMASAEACLAVQPGAAGMLELTRSGVTGLAMVGPHAAGGPADFEVRALFTKLGMVAEDPVTGSANACIARVLQAQGFTPGAASVTSYVQGYRARQGTALQCDGRIEVVYDAAGDPWIAGHSVTVIDGTLKP